MIENQGVSGRIKHPYRSSFLSVYIVDFYVLDVYT